MAFTKIFVAAVAVLSVATSVVAAPVAKVWDEKKFEPYDIYHARYNALECKNKHNTKFFDVCCGPLAHGQPLSTRPAECDPAKSASTQSNDGNDDECDDGDDDDGSVTTLNPTTTTKAATTTKATTTKTTTTKKATTTKTTAKATATANTSGSVRTGHGTWYTQNGVAGACGKKHSDSDLIGAMNFQLYGNVDKVSSVCGKKALVTNKKNGKQVTITFADACPSCPGKGDIDLSVGAFKKLDVLDTGLLNIEWQYLG